MCGYEKETAVHYLLHCNQYANVRLNTINRLPQGYQKLSILLKGNESLSDEENVTIAKTVQEYIKQTGRFSYHVS